MKRTPPFACDYTFTKYHWKKNKKINVTFSYISLTSTSLIQWINEITKWFTQYFLFNGDNDDDGAKAKNTKWVCPIS